MVTKIMWRSARTQIVLFLASLTIYEKMLFLDKTVFDWATYEKIC